jgi:flagellar motor switch protein FliM
MLGRQLADALAARVERGLKAGSEAAPAAIESTFLGSVAAPAGACLITATVSERIHRIEGRIQLTLDDAGTACLLRHLASTQRRRAPARAHPTPLKSRLHFRLVARLLQKDLTLGELLDIGVGDLIPVSLRAADVLIDDSRLMTATVAEHKGKLCLTNFEDVN